MFSLLTAVIYLAFISLGLPDSLLGSCWPVMHIDIGVPLSDVGMVSMIISMCTVISSLFSAFFTNRFGTHKVTTVSIFTTAAALFLFSRATAFWQLCVYAVPYGLGAGAIDSALNNYVSLHMESKHMSWLHCFWGIGAMTGPYVMGICIAGEKSWHGAYILIGIIQLMLGCVVLLSRSLWNAKTECTDTDGTEEVTSLGLFSVLKLPGAVEVCISFLFYCSIEAMFFNWTSSYFSVVYALNEKTAAFLASLFYIGMTFSRGVNGFVAEKIGDRKLIRIGYIATIAATSLALIPSDSWILAAAGFILAGVGCGPVYPSVIHATPDNFSAKYSGSVIGVEMAFAYLGTTFSPYILGKLSDIFSLKIHPVCVIFCAVTAMLLTDRANKKVDAK